MATLAQALAAASSQDKNSNRIGITNAQALALYLQTAASDPAQREKVGLVKSALRRHGYKVDGAFTVTSAR